MRRLILCTVLLALLLPGVVLAQGEQVTLTVENESEETICGVGIVPAGTSGEGVQEDMIHLADLSSGTQQSFTVDVGFYTVGLFDCDYLPFQGNSDGLFHRLPACKILAIIALYA